MMTLRERILLWVLIWLLRSVYVGMPIALWIARGMEEAIVMTVAGAIGIFAVQFAFVRPLRRMESKSPPNS